MDIEYIQCVACDNEWQYLFCRESNRLYRFKKNDMVLDVWENGTVGIYNKNCDPRYIRNVDVDFIVELLEQGFNCNSYVEGRRKRQSHSGLHVRIGKEVMESPEEKKE